jgi:hypothetical protein
MVNLMNLRCFKKKQNSDNKKALLSFFLIALFALSLVSFALTASAQVQFNGPRTTYGYISVAPSLVGVGQQATVNLWILPFPQGAVLQTWYDGFSGITVTFIKPDGTTDTFAPKHGGGAYPAGTTDPLASMYFFYKPDMAGNWSVTMSMSAQNFTDQTGTVQWEACTSQPAYFTVQKDPVLAGLLNGYPWSPLPTNYWSFPINSNNREWSAISGEWLTGLAINDLPSIANSGGFWQKYGTGPSTGHILWDEPYSFGGLVGGNLGTISYAPPLGGLFSSFIIMDGRLFTNVPSGGVGSASTSFECLDLATGKVVYTMPGQISCGINTPGPANLQANTNGVTTGVVLSAGIGSTPTPYLVQLGSVWKYYDPLTGDLQFSISNVSAVNNLAFVDGTSIVFGDTLSGYNTTTFEYAINYVWEWDLTKVVNGDWWTGIVWATEANSPGHLGVGDGSGRAALALSSDMSTIVYGGGQGANMVAGFNTQSGESVWNLTLPFTSESQAIQLYGTNNFLVRDPSDSSYYCYSDLTGELVWSTANVGTYPWSTVTAAIYANDNNNVYLPLGDGSVVALSLADGHIVWQSDKFVSSEYTANVIPYAFGFIGAGNNLYAYAGYSVGYEINPIPRFAMLVCIDATSGQIDWTLNGGIYPTASAYGYVIGIGEFDGNMYCIGKGQTSTSVSVQDNVISKGATTLITGNVLDQSPAQPNTPAVADDSMSEWMDYLHMQNATLINSPPTPKGVQVTLTAADQNGAAINIGTTMTDGAGKFAVMWTPPSTGVYTIKASFAGSESYWSSNDETNLGVTSADSANIDPSASALTSPDLPASASSGSLQYTSPPVAPSPSSEAASSMTLYIAIAAAVVIVVIAAVVVALRRRK